MAIIDQEDSGQDANMYNGIVKRCQHANIKQLIIAFHHDFEG